jgi:3-hydroxybutyryl-CoA dehydrogenase
MILIAGSGKMACNIGDFFLEKGFTVHWVTSSPEQQNMLRERIARIRRRTAKFFPEKERVFNADCHLPGTDDIPIPDVILESTDESLPKKKAVLASLAPLISGHTLLFSNSSSLLPGTLHQDCLGAHFFYPVQLTACLELIVPASCSEARRIKSLGFFREIGYDILEEDEKTAFLVNRLLLPLQAACLRALQDGVPAPLVEEASRSELIGRGQLSMMDAIGLDLIVAVVRNYRQLDTAAHPDCDLLITGLEKLVRLGKQGKKNGDGLLAGSALPWPEKDITTRERQNLQRHLAETLKKACLREYRRKNIALEQLQIVCERIFQASDFPRTFFNY